MDKTTLRVLRRFIAKDSVGKFELPPGHVFGMGVPKGGSACSKCKFLSEDGKHCGSTYFQDWRKSLDAEDPKKIPGEPDAYCCDVFTARDT